MEYSITHKTVIAGLSTVLRTSLGVCITVALSQSVWNGFSKLEREEVGQAKRIEDFETFKWCIAGIMGEPEAAMEI